MLQELQKVAEVWIACYLVLKMQKASSNIAMCCRFQGSSRPTSAASGDNPCSPSFLAERQPAGRDGRNVCRVIGIQHKTDAQQRAELPLSPQKMH
jgi:hypothetical protein